MAAERRVLGRLSARADVISVALGESPLAGLVSGKMLARAEQELLAFSDRLLHALQIYFHVSRTLSQIRIGFAPSPPWETETALVESFALHTRGLADFFFTFHGSRHASDAFAFQFFDSPSQWRQLVGEPGPWLRRVRFRPERGSPEAAVDRFGEQIAHLNFVTQPVSELARGWPVMQLANEVGRATSTFVTSVDDRLVHPSFKSMAWREIPVAARHDPDLTPLLVWTRPASRLRLS